MDIKWEDADPRQIELWVVVVFFFQVYNHYYSALVILNELQGLHIEINLSLICFKYSTLEALLSSVVVDKNSLPGLLHTVCIY